jgi:hypothetical protein
MSHLGVEINISKVNLRNESSDTIKKMTLVELYEIYFMKNDILPSDLDYGSVAYCIMKMQYDIIYKLLNIKQ